MAEKETKKTEEGLDLKTSIIIASVIIAGSLIYLGSQLGGGNAEFTAADFDRHAEGYQKRQEGNQAEAQAAQQVAAAEKAKNIVPISNTDYVKGDKDANITIFEYSDFLCGYCKQFYKRSQAVAEKNKDVNLVTRSFLRVEDSARFSTLAGCAANQGGSEAYYKYQDKLFQNLQSAQTDEGASKLASDISLDVKKFNACIKGNTEVAKKIQSDHASGVAAGVSGTPGVIIRNNTTGKVLVMPGAVPTETLEAAIAEYDSINI